MPVSACCMRFWYVMAAEDCVSAENQRLPYHAKHIGLGRDRFVLLYECTEVSGREILQPRPPGLKRRNVGLKLLEPLLDYLVICAGQQFGQIPAGQLILSHR